MATGLTPHKYLIQRRVERARSLPSDTNLAVAKVARAVGFSNSSHLAHHVRRPLGAGHRGMRRGDTDQIAHWGKNHAVPG